MGLDSPAIQPYNKFIISLVVKAGCNHWSTTRIIYIIQYNITRVLSGTEDVKIDLLQCVSSCLTTLFHNEDDQCRPPFSRRLGLALLGCKTVAEFAYTLLEAYICLFGCMLTGCLFAWLILQPMKHVSVILSDDGPTDDALCPLRRNGNRVLISQQPTKSGAIVSIYIRMNK